MFSVVFVFGCLLVPALGTSSLDDTRIVGGSDAQPGQFPYQVSLRSYNRHFCEGSIITTRTVLTAAHCTGREISTVAAIVEATYLNSGGVAHRVSRFISHENYNSNTVENDIAVAILAVPITYNQYAQPIALPRYSIGDNVQAVASGWGYTSYPGSAPNNLQYFYTNTISFTQCRKMHGGSLFVSQICVFKQPGQGVCFGDAGSPLVSDGQLHGLASVAYLCAIGYPDLFTRVYSFVPWIQQNSVQ